MAKQAGAKHRADDGDALYPIGQVWHQRADAHRSTHRRRLPALGKPGHAQHHGQARRNDVGCHTRDHLIAAVADTGQPVQP